jgi:hypothetical protein
VIVSHDYKLVFFCNPRCASTSIGRTLQDELGAERVFMPRGQRLPDQHTAPAEFMEMPLHAQCHDYTWFTTVRHPMERLVSLYGFYKYMDASRVRRKSFEQWVRGLRPTDYGRLPNAHWTSVPMGNAKYVGTLVPFIVPFEDMQSGFDEVMERVGAPQATIQEDVRIDHPPFRQAYTPELWDTVTPWFQSDLRFGYDLSWQNPNDSAT